MIRGGSLWRVDCFELTVSLAQICGLNNVVIAHLSLSSLLVAQGRKAPPRRAGEFLPPTTLLVEVLRPAPELVLARGGPSRRAALFCVSSTHRPLTHAGVRQVPRVQVPNRL